MRTPALSTVVLTLLFACGDGDGSGSGDHATGPIEPTTSDSAGVTLYQHTGDAIERAPVVTLDSTTLAVIGGGAEDDFSRVFHVRLLSDGRVALYDDQLGAVRIFDAQGAPLGSHGRKGEGPGEFSFVSALIVLAGDTLVVHDPGTSRLTLIDPTAGVVRSFAVPSMGMFVSYAVTARSANGWYFVPAGYAVNGPPELATDGRRPVVPILLVTESAGVTGGSDTVGNTLGLELVRHRMELMGQAREMSAARHFAPQGVAAGWTDGTLLVADNESWELRLLGVGGATTGVIRMDRPRRGTSPVMLDSLAAAMRLQLAGSPQVTPEMLEAFITAERSKPMVDSLPHFSAAYPTARDVMWLGEYMAPGDSGTHFTAIDRNGRILGRLTLPTGSRPVAFGSDRVILRSEDADGLVRFEVRGLHFP